MKRGGGSDRIGRGREMIASVDRIGGNRGNATVLGSEGCVMTMHKEREGFGRQEAQVYGGMAQLKEWIV